MTDPNLGRDPARRKLMAAARSRHGRRDVFRPEVVAVEARILLATYLVPSQYASIEAAVAMANAHPSNSNEVLVSPGTYHESNITITSPLTLVSTNGSGSTTIDGGNATVPNDGIIQVVGNSGNVTIGAPGQGFTLQNPPLSSSTGDINIIDINNINAPVTVQNDVLIGLNGVGNPFDTGILAESTPFGSPITVQNNTFEEMFQGILFQQTVGAGSISNNTFTNLVASTDTTVSPAHVYEPEAIVALTLGGPAYNVSGLSIVGNNFSAFNGLAITVEGGYQGYAPAQFSNVLISSNVVTSIGFAPNTYRAGITLIDDPGTAGTDGSGGGVVNSTISDNTLMAQTSCASGSVGVWLLGPNNNLTIDNNFIENLDRGILIDQQVPGEAYASGVVANQNSFTGNNIGILNPSTNSIDASYNYWGTTDATSVKAQANGGVHVDYNPWLGSGTDTSANPGFQPSLTPAITDAAQISGNDSVKAGTPYTLVLSQVSTPAHVGTISYFTVNFGNGTIVSNIPPGTYQYTYTPSSQATYTISATATNTSGQTFQVANTLNVTATVVSTLVVTTFTPTSSGFHVRFNDTINTGVLNLYAGPTTTTPAPPDVTLTGPSNTTIFGSLKLDPDNKGFTFVATGPPLPSGTYTATLMGVASGVQDANTGYPLDGTGSGSTAGSNYVSTFSVPSTSGPTVSVPDFARGPGQPVIIPAATGTGLPVQISNGSGITSVMFVITYNPSLLTIDPTRITLGSSMPAGTQFVYNATIPGRLAICITSPTPLNSGAQDLVELNASVPSNAPYRSKAVINVQLASLNGSTNYGVGDQAVDDVTFLGNATGSGSYTAADVSQLQGVLQSSNLYAGFNNYPLVDPTIIGDIADTGSLNGTDVSILQHYLDSNDVIPQIPTYTGPPSNRASGPDPELFLPQTLAGMPGATLAVPVELLQTNATAIGLDSFNLVLSFDPATFSVSDIRAGALASGFDLTESVDEARGLIFISGTGDRPLTLAPGTLGDLVLVDFTILANAKATSSGINLLGNSGDSITSLNDGGLTLVPAPSNAGNDPVDGVVAIGGRRTQPLFAPGRGPVFPSLAAERRLGASHDVAIGPLAAPASAATPAGPAPAPAVAIAPASTTSHAVAVASTAANPAITPGSSATWIPLTTGGDTDDPSRPVAAKGHGPLAVNGASIIARRVVFRQQALTRVIASDDPIQ